MSNLAGKYLSFELGREEYAIRVAQVREIMGVQEITAVPQMPSHVLGVINLRGRVIPVVDLRLKFGLDSAEFTPRTCIVVVQIPGEAGVMQMGVIVDAVSEVLTLAPADIENPPDFGPDVNMPYLLGLAKVKGRLKILLAIEDLLNTSGLQTAPGLANSGLVAA